MASSVPTALLAMPPKKKAKPKPPPPAVAASAEVAESGSAVAEVAEVAVLRFPRVVHLVTLLCSPAALTYDPTLAFERGKPATVGRTDAPS